MEKEESRDLRERIARLGAELEARDRQIESLKVSNLFFETLFDGISEEIMVVDPHGNIKDSNRTFLEKYGLIKKNILGKKCFDIKGRLGRLCRLDAEYCPLVKARTSGEMVEMTHFYKGPDGQNREHVLMMYPLRSSGKEIDCFIEIARDVTEYRALIRKLKASEKRFRAILDNATDAIINIDENQRIILFNNAAQRIFQYEREEILGKGINLLIPFQYGEPYALVTRFLKMGAPEIMEKTLSLIHI